MKFENLQFSIKNDIAEIALNRPDSINALNRPLLAEIIEALDYLKSASEPRVLIIKGNGRGFSSGADLSSGSSPAGAAGFDAGEVLEQYYNPMMERFYSLPIPIVSAVHGPVVGAGCMIALTADIVVAARSAYFLQAFSKIGLVPDAGSTWWLPRLIGPGRALSMMLLGEKIPAETALQWGMIYKVVEDSELAATVNELADRLAKGPTQAYSLIRNGVRKALTQEFIETLRQERANQKQAGDSEDFLEGVKAFREKRKPEFKNK